MPATTRGDDLVAVEGEDPGDAERSRGPAPIGRTESFGRVLNERHLELFADRLQRHVVGGFPVEIDGDHRRR